MIPVHTIKPSFSGGEFAPSLYARTDIQKYATGARTLRNFIVHPHGGISNRPGLHYVATSKKDNSKVRVIDFQFSSTQNYVIEFGDYYCRFYTDDAQVHKIAGDDWAVATDYIVNDIATDSSIIYRCLQAHTSATLASDITNGKWTIDTGSWAAGTAHIIGQYVYYTNGTASPAFYYCATAHTAGTFTADLAAGRWVNQSIYEIPSPYGENDLVDIRVAQSADILFIAHPDFAPRELIRYYDTVWAFIAYDFQNGPFRLANDDSTLTMKTSVTSGTGTLTASSAYFYPTMVGGLMQLNHQVEGKALTQKFTTASISSSIYCGGTWRVISHGTWTGRLRVEKSSISSTGATGSWTVMRQFSSQDDFNVDTYGNEDMSDGALPFYIRLQSQVATSGTFSGTLNADLTSDPYNQMGVAQITSYASTTLVNIEIQRPVASTVTTSNWSEGAWSDFRGFPSTVVFAQDRLIWGGSLYDPQTMWMTQTGNYYDFMRNDPLVDSDGITINLPSQKLNSINAMVPLLQLLVFSTGGEWSIGSTANNVFSPTTMQTKLNGYTGSSGVQPCVIVNRAIYVQARGCVVRDLGYDLFTDTFTGSNLSILSNHLFTNYNILDLAYQQDPDSLVWAVRDDGILLSMTYMREQEVLAWTWHDTYQGDDLFESVCSIPGTGYNEVWVVVNRDGQRMIERMDKRLNSLDREDQFFVDSGITFDATLATITDIYTKFLCHCNGVQDSTTFTDEKSHVITAQNDAKVETTKHKFGTGSCQCYKLAYHEVDYMEYSSDALAQAQWITNATAANDDNTYTKLRIHFDGSDGATTYTAETGQAVTFAGNAQLDTANKKFGTAALLLDGTGDYCEVPNSADWTFGSGAFTIDCWIYPDDTEGTGGDFIETRTSYADSAGFSLAFSSDKLCLNSGGTYRIIDSPTITPAAWYHIAVVGNGAAAGSRTIKLYKNGIQVGSTYTANYNFTNNRLRIGCNHSTYAFDGSMDEVRVSKGIQRWTANFTPPTYEYVPTTNLQCYSENTIKTQGTYSLKTVSNTLATGLKLTSTLATHLDLTGINYLYFDMQSVRTGANVTLTLHDSGGTNSTLTPSILSANTWETKAWDISAVADADKDDIDSILITTTNASLTNTCYFDNWYWYTTGDGYLTIPDTADFTCGTANFTAETFVNFNDTGGDQYFLGQYGNATACWNVYKDSTNRLCMYFVYAGTVVGEYSMISPWSPLTDTWYHLEFCRNGITGYIYIDGVSQPLTETTAFGTNDLGNIPATVAFGARGDETGFVKGWLDEIRYSNGICRHTSNFTPPSRAYTVYGAGSASRAITGLSHLEGRTVAILADGNVLDQQIVTGGTVTLADVATLAHVGLPYYSDLETLNVEVPLPDGTIQGRRVNISRVVIRVLNSRGGWLGPDYTNMHELLGTYDTSSGSSLFTDDVKITLGQGYKDGGRFCFRQIDPLPITILGVIPIFTPGGTTQLD